MELLLRSKLLYSIVMLRLYVVHNNYVVILYIFSVIGQNV